MQRRQLLTASAAALAAPAVWAQAQAWPNGPVRIIVGFPPGGGTDALARVVGQKLTVMWNQQVIRREQGRRRWPAGRRVRGAAAQ